ncbi:MAG: hypothetical protein WCT04_00705 [Planctomycetota bacterium]
MALLAGANNRQEANEIYNTTVAGMVAFCGLIALLALPFCAFAPLSAWFNLTQITPREIQITMVLLVWSVVVQLAFYGVLAIFCWDGLQAFGSMLGTAQRGCEAAACVAMLLWRQPPWVLALTIVVVRLLSLIVVVVCIRIKLPWVKAGWSLIKWRNLKGLVSASVGNMLFPFAMSINLQGMIVVVNIMFGPASVVVFTTTRVITRALLQWSETIKRAVRAEISMAYGNGNLPLAASLYKKSCRLGFWSLLAWSAVLCLSAPTLFRILVRGKVEHKPVFDEALFYSLLAVVMFNSFWLLGALVLEATNRVIEFSLAYLVVSAFSVVLSYVLMRNFGFKAAAYGSLIGDAIMIYIALNKSMRMLGEGSSAFLRFVFLPWGARLPSSAA